MRGCILRMGPDRLVLVVGTTHTNHLELVDSRFFVWPCIWRSGKTARTFIDQKRIFSQDGVVV